MNFCFNTGVIICNGRFGPLSSCVTSTSNTVIDYMLCSPDLLQYISYMIVLDFNPMLSDIHRSIKTALMIDNRPKHTTHFIPSTKESDRQFKIKRWEQQRNAIFIENINRDKIRKIEQDIANFDKHQSDPKQISCCITRNIY